MQSFMITPINDCYHNHQRFREQMSVLVFSGEFDGKLKFIRSFLTVGSPGLSGFDKNSEGKDTHAGWLVLDDLIENENVRGTFHTHPPGVRDFSYQDYRSMIGLSKANGIMPLFHGVQSLNSDVAHFMCFQMVQNKVFFYDLGWIKSDVRDPVLILPAPPKTKTIMNIFGFEISS